MFNIKYIVWYQYFIGCLGMIFEALSYIIAFSYRHYIMANAYLIASIILITIPGIISYYNLHKGKLDKYAISIVSSKSYIIFGCIILFTIIIFDLIQISTDYILYWPYLWWIITIEINTGLIYVGSNLNKL